MSTIGSRIDQSSDHSAEVSRALLFGGIIAGPFYIILGLIQALTRAGFDLTHHDLSLLSNGHLGWIQVGNFLISGLLVMAAAIGMRHVTTSRWLPRLVGVYGLGVFGAGLFSADPAHGFPPGTPADANSVSWHGMLHLVCGSLGFLALIVACFVAARRFSQHGNRRWTIYSLLTGVLFFISFAGIASGSDSAAIVIGFSIGVLLAWSWISLFTARLVGKTDEVAD